MHVNVPFFVHRLLLIVSFRLRHAIVFFVAVVAGASLGFALRYCQSHAVFSCKINI